jgi:outer membrane protein assembly factor BamE
VGFEYDAESYYPAAGQPVHRFQARIRPQIDVPRMCVRDECGHQMPTTAVRTALLACLMLLAGCVYRIAIQQGNFLDAKDIDRVAVGMTRVQVRSLLGTPMVADPFESSRWDYLYYLRSGHLSKPERRHFVVFFDGDKVTRIERPQEPPVS